MTAYHGEESWGIEVLEIYNVTTEKRPFHQEMKVEGKAQVTIEEEEPMVFDFVYRGSPNENKKGILNYIRGRALNIRLEKQRKHNNTLQNYVRELSDK